MEKNIKEAISIIEDVRKSMPECTNKAFLKGALNELNEALQIHNVVQQSEPFYCWDEEALGNCSRCTSQCEICEKVKTKQ